MDDLVHNSDQNKTECPKSKKLLFEGSETTEKYELVSINPISLDPSETFYGTQMYPCNRFIGQQVNVYSDHKVDAIARSIEMNGGDISHLPPIKIYHLQGEVVVLDGHHTYRAIRKLLKQSNDEKLKSKLGRINCEVYIAKNIEEVEKLEQSMLIVVLNTIESYKEYLKGRGSKKNPHPSTFISRKSIEQ